MNASARARTVGGVAAGRLFGALATVDRGRQDLLGVLTYHRIVERGAGIAPGIASADPAMFAEHAAQLADAYHPVSLADVLARLSGGPRLPRRSVLVTFDDAYRDFGRVAWPILRDQGVPAVLFVPTAMPDGSAAFWWDRLHAALSVSPDRPSWASPVGAVPLVTPAERSAAYRRLRERIKTLPHGDALRFVDEVVSDLRSGTAGQLEAVTDALDWSELRSLADDGVALAAHSRTHPLLTQLADEDLDEEVAGSLAELAAGLDRPVMPAFAYPSGAYSTSVRAAAERAGVQVAFTTRRGLNDLERCDWLALRRINVGQRTDRALLRAQLDRRIGPLVAGLRQRGARRRVGSGTAVSPASTRS